MSSSQPAPSSSLTLKERLKAASVLLQQVAEDRTLLTELSPDERQALIKVAGEIYCPDSGERRRLVKATLRHRKAEKTKADQNKLQETGIRKLRREKVFTTPNVYAPLDFEQKEI